MVLIRLLAHCSEIERLPKSFRHTIATRAAQAGIDLATPRCALGAQRPASGSEIRPPGAQHKRAAMSKYGEAIQAVEITGRPN